MKYIRQFGLIAGVTCAGEVIKYFIPLPVPGSIYGLLLLLILLVTKLVKLEDVRETAEFLIEIMPMMFIPAAAGLLTSWEKLSEMLFPVCVITAASTFLVMGVTGKVTEKMLKGKDVDENVE